jgi:RNA polymerase sigma factor for flagellar operon FliA
MIITNDMILEHAPLVARISRHIRSTLPHNIELDDIIQAGMLGLMDALPRYDSSLGGSFNTYSSRRIRGAIIDQLRDQDILPRHQRTRVKAASRAELDLRNELGRDPLASEIAEKMGVTEKVYRDIKYDAAAGEPLYYEDSDVWVDEPYQEDASYSEICKTIVAALGLLTERERYVVQEYAIEGRSLLDIAEELGVTQMRVCQIKTGALKKMQALYEH